VNGPSVHLEDLSYLKVSDRLREIQVLAHEDEDVVVVLAGYSPLVALLHDVASNQGLEQVFYIRDSRGAFVEGKLTA
jgi:hypothetical protein